MSYEIAQYIPMRIHVRAIVDENQIVFRVWNKNVGQWIYEIVDQYWFDLRESIIRNPKRSRA